MSSKQEYAEFIADQISTAGNIRYRKMFSEYGLYCDGKFFAVILDNRLFIKVTDRVKELYPDLREVHEYGAPHHFLIEDIDDREKLTEIVRVTCEALPEKMKRKKS